VVGRLARHFDPVTGADARILLADDLDVESLHHRPALAVEPSELVLHDVTDLVGDANSSPLQDKIHDSSISVGPNRLLARASPDGPERPGRMALASWIRERTGRRAIAPRRESARQRARRGHHSDLGGARCAKHPGALGRRGAGREDVVDEDHARR